MDRSRLWFAGRFPGPEATSYFGYYDGGTVYDPDDPSTMEDDYILFRMRVEGDPSSGDAFDSKHWNVLSTWMATATRTTG